jgi:hypothetical protein
VIRLYVALAALLLSAAGFLYYGHTRYEAGIAHQVALTAKQDAKAAKAAQEREDSMRAAYNDLAQRYEQDKAHAQAEHDRAVAELGTLRLRDKWACPGVPAAAVASRERDAARTQALADRTAAAIRIVRLGYAADQREADLGAQVTALQNILRSERQ